MKLENRRVLITGGGSGVGLELARQLVDANDVVIAGRTTAKLDAARAANPTLRVAQLDVTSEDSASSVIEWLESNLGGLDVLVNNAGVMRGGPFSAPDAATSSVEELEVNLGGAIRMTRLALPLLTAAPQAAIVFVSSAVALTAVPQLAVYAATKAGMHSLARSLRAELSGTSVRVFEALLPVVDTDLARHLDGAKVPAWTVAKAILAGIHRDKQQIAIDRVRPLVVISRVAPRIADGIVRRAVQPPPWTSVHTA
jgi:uncharacterized oxidoreductase